MTVASASAPRRGTSVVLLEVSYASYLILI